MSRVIHSKSSITTTWSAFSFLDDFPDFLDSCLDRLVVDVVGCDFGVISEIGCVDSSSIRCSLGG